MEEAEQLTLSPVFFSGQELLEDQEELRRRGVFSGKIIDRNISKRDAIVRALAEGIGVNRIAKAFSVSVHTVMALRDRHPDLIAAEKQALSRQFGRLLKLSADRYEEALINDEVSPSQLPVAMGILSDKKALLDGDPTLRVDHGKRNEVTADDVREYLARLKSANGHGARDLIEAGETDHQSDSTDAQTVASEQ